MFDPLKVGGWAFGEVLTSDQMNQANTDLPFALDGRDGGDYTPSDNLDIQTPTTKEIVLNGCTFESQVNGGLLHCAGLAGLTVDTDVAIGGDLTVPTGNTIVTNFTATGAQIYTDTIIGTTSSHALTINAKTTANQRVRSPKGMIKGGFSGSTYQYAMANYDVVYIPEGQAVAASTIWQISTGNTHIDGVQSGEIISFRNLGTSQPIVIKDPAGTTIVTALGPLGGSNLIRVDIAYDPTAAAYVIIDRGYN